MKKLIALFFVFGFIFTGISHGQQSFDPQKAEYLWPTEASQYLTSTFGETRAAHFHAALDIKTWGRRGYEVYATRDGVVDRIAIGPRGYGKVIYLKHSDGSYSVYAHLLAFNSELQQLADSIRFANNYQFEIERFWEWRDIKVEQGEVIGYSGASGIGPPHLHFELRTPSHKPFNPLLTNLGVKDTIAPQIEAISIEPLSTQSSIEDKNQIYIQQAWQQNGVYQLGSLEVSGPVGIAVNAFDQSNKVNNSYAVYELSMSVDGEQFFHSKVDSFSYSETDQMFIDRVYPILQENDSGYQRLFVADGNSLPFYQTGKNNGTIDLPPGSYDVTITAKDYYGNKSTAKLDLNVTENRSEESSDISKISEQSEIASPYHWHWFTNWVTLSNEQFAKATIASSDNTKFTQHENGVAVSLAEDHQFMHIPEAGPVVFRRIDPNNMHLVSSATDNNFAIFPKNIVHDTVSVAMAVDHTSWDSLSVNMMPEAFPLKKAYNFYIQRDSTLPDTAKQSFYRFERDDQEWELVPTKFTSTHIVAEAESLGLFKFMQDTTAPSLFNPRLTQRPDGQWLIMVNTTDNLSGIDYSRTKMWVNGMQGIAEFEPEDDRFVYYHPEFRPTSTMNIKVVAYDKMGNKVSRSFRIQNNEAKK